MATWPITPADVQNYIGPMADTDRLAEATDAAIAYVEARRSDLAAGFTAGTAPGDVWLGAIRYATLLYNARSSPTGYAAFGDGTIDVTGEPGYPAAMRLIGWRRPVTA